MDLTMGDIGTLLLLGLLLGGIYALISIGLNLIFGVIRIVNFAHGEILMIAMYLTYILCTHFHISPYLAMIAVAPAMFVFGLIVQRLLIQPLIEEPLMQIFVTFGLMIFLENLALVSSHGEALGLQNGQDAVTILGQHLSIARVVAFIAATAITIGLHFFLQRTMLGKAIRAITQDRRAAAGMGIDVNHIYLLTFGLGAAISGIAGALLMSIFTLTPTIGGNFVLAAFAVVVLGGLGSVWGAYIGGLIVGLIEVFAGYYIDPSLKSAVWFIIFIAVLVCRPSGLFGMVGAEEVGLREQH
jgi:branched-chain amino acid transport system permease protein